MQPPQPDLSDPKLPDNLNRVRIPIIEARHESLKWYGLLVDEPEDFQIEITRWFAQGWCRVDLDTGDQGGTTEGFLEVNGKVMCFMEKTMLFVETTSLGMRLNPIFPGKTTKTILIS